MNVEETPDDFDYDTDLAIALRNAEQQLNQWEKEHNNENNATN